MPFLSDCMFCSFLCAMDSDCIVAVDGHEVAHQNGEYNQIPALGEDFVVLDNDHRTSDRSTESAVQNGNAKVVVKLDNGIANTSCTEEIKEESDRCFVSNGLRIAKVGGHLCMI